MTTPTRETMTYNQGKIYKIEPIIEHDEGDIYIGSTCCKYLSQRMKAHRGDYKCWKEGKRHLTSSYNLFDKYGLENCQILLIESVCCENINELKTREAYYIRTFKCVNKVIPLRTPQEYILDNKDKIAEYSKEYYERKKDAINEKQKEYNVANKDTLAEYKKEYYEKNKDAINEKAKEYRDANTEKEKERKKEYYEKNKVAINEKRRLKKQAKQEAEK